MIDVEHWLTTGEIALLAIVVFAESGLLAGFFLPGDSLLFVAGFLSSAAARCSQVLVGRGPTDPVSLREPLRVRRHASDS